VFQLYDRLVASRRCGEGTALGCRLDLEDLAISGATTDTLVRQLPKVVQLIEARNGDATPVDDVNLITLDIGGNDVFRPIVTACTVDPQSAGCLTAIQTALAQVAANYRLILGELRAAAGPRTAMAVMTYYNPLPGCRLAALTPLADLVLEGGPQVPAGLNDIIRAQAAAVGAAVAETGPLIGVSDLTGDCLHPDNSGHEKIADAFQTVLDVDSIVGPPAG
jgi:lysophospholipase L1-like esterase